MVVERERAARDAARRPYLAPDRTSVVLSRIATNGSTQFEDVANHLAASGLAARPDLVFGVYRVPDRLDPKLSGSESGRDGSAGAPTNAMRCSPGCTSRRRPGARSPMHTTISVSSAARCGR